MYQLIRILREGDRPPAEREAARKGTRGLGASASRREDGGFTLIELLITIAIIGILAMLVASNWPHLRLMTQRSAALSNMRAIGVAFHLYAADHDSVLPQRTTGTSDRWPRLLSIYLDDIKVYAAAGDGNVNRFDKEQLLSNSGTTPATS